MAFNLSSVNTATLFSHRAPNDVWLEAHSIIKGINADYDFRIVKTTFEDVVRLFHGEYLGFQEIKTLYHDLNHTLDTFLCTARLAHGIHLSGNHLSNREITLLLIAALMHDVGYAQLLDDETGTGAQYTRTHIERGIEFMEGYLAEQGFPIDLVMPLKYLILSTNAARSLSDIHFPDDRTRLLGQMISTADLTGQMADRTYLEKLLFLYLELEEAQFGTYADMHDLLNKTRQFYTSIRTKLDADLGGLYRHLTLHFKEQFGIESNFYLESIEKNMAYLSTITARDEKDRLDMLKRGGIVEKSTRILAQRHAPQGSVTINFLNDPGDNT